MLCQCFPLLCNMFCCCAIAIATLIHYLPAVWNLYVHSWQDEIEFITSWNCNQKIWTREYIRCSPEYLVFMESPNEVLKYTIHRESIILYILIWTSFFWRGGYWFSSYRHLVISVLSYKDSVDSLLACFVSYMQWIPQITSGATPADLFIASMAAKPFWSTYLHTWIQALVGLEPGIECLILILKHNELIKSLSNWKSLSIWCCKWL